MLSSNILICCFLIWIDFLCDDFVVAMNKTIKCPCGTFHSREGYCLVCLAGKYTGVTNAARCKDCPAGETSTEKSCSCYPISPSSSLVTNPPLGTITNPTLNPFPVPNDVPIQYPTAKPTPGNVILSYSVLQVPNMF